MTENRVFVLILIGTLLLTAIAMLSMAALGVRGVGLSLGFIFPMFLASYATGRMVMHFGRIRRGESDSAHR